LLLSTALKAPGSADGLLLWRDPVLLTKPKRVQKLRRQARVSSRAKRLLEACLREQEDARLKARKAKLLAEGLMKT
jgi:hypothetical protein